MATTRCKFKCIETGTSASGNTENPFYHRAKFQAVYGDSPENKEFFLWTPNGTLEVSTLRKQSFEAGKEYYLDITEAE